MLHLTFHPLANVFPLLEGEELDALVADIAASGLCEAVWLYEGQILDGCSRCYLNPLIKVSIYHQWLMISSRQIGIVLNASHDKKLHWGAQRVNT